MKRYATMLALIGVLAAPVANATVPSTMSYQGVLSDNLGNIQPDGLYNFVFKIYNVGSGGVALWTETDNSVLVTKGGFTVLLGNATPLNLAFDAPYYLGISVNGQPELTPRVPLASSAYGLSLRLPFAGSENGSGAVFSIRNASGATAIQALDQLDVGASGGANSSLNWYGNSASLPLGHAYNNIYGGELDLRDNNGAVIAALTTQTPTSGYMFVLGDESGLYGIGTSGAEFGPDAPWLAIIGASRSAVFDMSKTGTASVVLPANAVDASEVLDEPGIAQNHGAGSFIVITSINPSALTDLTSITITIPAPGYIVLTGDFEANMVNTSARFIGYQISATSAAPLDNNEYFYCGQSGSSFLGYLPCSIHRTYFESVAGSYTFYLQAYNGAGSSAAAWDPTLTAAYYASSYGPVTVLASPAEAARYPRTTPSPAIVAPGQATGAGVEVDLSDLERQVKARQAELDAARLRLDQARFQQQASAPRVAAPAAVKRQP